MTPNTKQEYRDFVVENGRIDESGQTSEQWQEQVEEEAKFEAEIQDGKEWDSLK